VSFSPNNINPYAAPVHVEEDVPGYDLLKIARRYNRLVPVLKWFVLLFVIEILLFVCVIPIALTDFSGSDSSTVMNTVQVVLWCLFLPVHLAWCILAYYTVFIAILIALALKFRTPAMILIFLGAISPITVLVVLQLRGKAAQILRNGGIEIINGKVDLANIPVDNDY